MKIGILSDIHSNIYALKACIETMEAFSPDEYLFLGDYISDTPYTRETLDFLYDFWDKHTCHILRGNREEYMLSQRKAIKDKTANALWRWNSASGNLLYAYMQLTEKDLDYFEQLPITFCYEKEGLPAITCCHGSPENARELLQHNAKNTKKWLETIESDYLLCAHTHYPGETVHQDKHYFNTGCIGISIGDVGQAQCMILESICVGEKIVWKPTFLKIPYDYKRVVKDMCQSEHIDKAPWFINSNLQILLTGVDQAATMVELASEMAKKEGQVWPEIDEIYFEKAANILGIPDYRDSRL